MLINLLPHRAAARNRRRRGFYAALCFSAFVGMCLAGGIYFSMSIQIARQQDQNQLLENEIERLDLQIKEIATLQEEIAALRARQQAVGTLQANRNLPVHMLNELAAQIPDGVYLTELKQSNEIVAVTGVAQSNARVSELLRNLGSRSRWLKQPELIEIVAGNVTLSSGEQRRVSYFRLRVKLLPTGETK